MSGYLLASDFDGTLCFEGKHISDEDRDAVRRFREAGNRFVIVTGRTRQTAEWAFERTDFHDMDAYLCSSGTYGLDPDGNVIYKVDAPARKLPEIAEYFARNNASYFDIDVDMVFYDIIPDGDDSPFQMMSLEELGRLDHFNSLNVAFENAEKTAEIRKEILEMYGDILNPLQNGDFLDIPPAGVDKAVSAGRIARIFGIDEDNIYTAGDSGNDIAMVERYHGRVVCREGRNRNPEELIRVAEKKVGSVREIIDEIMDRG